MGRRIIWIAAAAYAAAGVLYVVAFHGHSWGGPSSWGAFGDFVGGIVNPALSLLTIYIVITTFEHEKKIAEIERMDTDRRHAIEVRAARCDAAIRWFEEESRRTVSGRIGIDNAGSLLFLDAPTLLMDLFADEKLQRNFRTAFENETFERTQWSGRFNVCVNALIEVADACAVLDQLDESRMIAASYRRRTSRAARFLSSIGQTPQDDAMRRLIASPLFLGDVGEVLPGLQ